MKILMTNFTKMVNDSGGVAKVCCAFANEMVKRGHQVSILHSDEKTGAFFYSVDNGVKLYNVKQNKDGSLIKFPGWLKLVRELYRAIDKRKARVVNRYFGEKYLLDNCKAIIEQEKPDVIVCYQIEGSIYLLHGLKVDIPVITMSHREPRNDYDSMEQFALEKSAVYQVLSPSFERYINSIFPKVNVVTIGNAVPSFEYSADLDVDKEQYKIIFVGRLTKNHKRPHLLVQAFAKIASKHPNWIVELWGQKFRESYYAELQHFIKNNNLENRVLLKGTTNDVPLQLSSGDVFAFPSEYEAFGLALAEGLSVGLPAVGYKSCPGVNELIKDGINGYLCDDGVDAFAESLDRLMGDKALRIKLGKAAKESMKEFAPQNIWDKWENLLNNYRA